MSYSYLHIVCKVIYICKTNVHGSMAALWYCMLSDIVCTCIRYDHYNYTVVVQVESSETVYTVGSCNTEVELVCEVYGYPRDSSGPVWIHGSDTVTDDCWHTINVASASLLSGSSVSSTNRVESRLTISNVPEEDTGEYTCSVQGNSSTVTLTVESGGS